MKSSVISFFRKSLRTLHKLPSYDQQKIYHDYIRLKFTEHWNIRDKKKIKQLLVDGNDELDWVISVMNRNSVHTPTDNLN